MAARQKKPRVGPERPLKWGDLTRGERAEASRLLQQKQQNLPNAIQHRVDQALAGKNKKAKPADVRALTSGKLRAAKVLGTIPNMAREVVSRTERAATGFGLKREGSQLAGTGFYFDARRPYAALDSPTHSVKELAQASSRLSPKTNPESERETLTALHDAHQEGYIHFHPAVVEAVRAHYAEEDGKDRGYVVPQELHGKEVAFAHVPHQVVNALRKQGNRSVAESSSMGTVNWEGVSKVGIDANVERAHEMLRGNPRYALSTAKNPKQFGYASSIAQATPDVEDEYRFRSMHLARVVRGEQIPGQQILDTTGQLESNEGMLSNEAPIAADTWTRRATSGQHLDVAGPVADVQITKKEGVGKGDPTVTPIGIEHAQQQEAVERASRDLQAKHGLPFTVPSRLIQETGGWAQPRREHGGDSEYNAEQNTMPASRRTLNQSQFAGGGDEQMELF